MEIKKQNIAASAKESLRETRRTVGGATGAPAKLWKRAACRPAEQFHETAAAWEGLLPHHHPPVAADDLISPHVGRRTAEEDSQRVAACCPAASVFHFFY